MEMLQRNIKKKQKFVTFLKEKYRESKTSLSLQGLLLKPVQRFPQYILFLQVCYGHRCDHRWACMSVRVCMPTCDVYTHVWEAINNDIMHSPCIHTQTNTQTHTHTHTLTGYDQGDPTAPQRQGHPPTCPGSLRDYRRAPE